MIFGQQGRGRARRGQPSDKHLGQVSSLMQMGKVIELN